MGGEEGEDEGKRMMQRERNWTWGLFQYNIKMYFHDKEVSPAAQLRYSAMGRQPKLKCAPHTQHNNRAKAGRDHLGREIFYTNWTECSGSDWYLVLLYCPLNLSSGSCFIGATEEPGEQSAMMLSVISSGRASRRRKKNTVRRLCSSYGFKY